MLEVDNTGVTSPWIPVEMTTSFNGQNQHQKLLHQHHNQQGLNKHYKHLNGSITDSRMKPNEDIALCNHSMSLPLDESTKQEENKLNNITEDDELSPLPEDLNCSLNNSPRMSPCISPVIVRRQRCHTIDNAFQRQYQRAKSTPSSIPKDPIQPKCGSIGDIHGHESASHDEEGEEEDEFFSELPPMRIRSKTCPDSMLHNRRKLKVRSLRRPSTPPPSDLCTGIKNMVLPSNVDKEIDILVNVDRS